MVNLYAFGYLAKHVRPGTILSELTQLGIEVTVRQLPPQTLSTFQKNKGKPKDDVRKDLVIWRTPRMTLWNASRRCKGTEILQECDEPLAVMEWKLNHFLNGAAHPKNRRDYKGKDIRWLRETSGRIGTATDFTGYAVLVEHTRQPKELCCVRVHQGQAEYLPGFHGDPDYLKAD